MVIAILDVHFCIKLLFSPAGARVICCSSAGEANCGDMPKSGMVLFEHCNSVI